MLFSVPEAFRVLLFSFSSALWWLTFSGAVPVLPPKTLWKITEKWKTKGAGQPSDKYIVIMRILGVVFAAVGGGLLIWG